MEINIKDDNAYVICSKGGTKFVEGLEKNDVVFMYASNLRGWEDISNAYEKDKITTIYASSETLDEEIDDMLLAVRYLGNDIFEEMVTGEKIAVFNNYKKRKYPEISQVSMVDGSLHKCDTYEKIAFTKKMAQEAVFTFDNERDGFHTAKADILKKEYLKYNDMDRKNYISTLKENAIQYRDLLDDYCKQTIKHLEFFGDEDLAMAELENRLFDLADKNFQKIK